MRVRRGVKEGRKEIRGSLKRNKRRREKK